jgi:adenylate kinase family enzyme
MKKILICGGSCSGKSTFGSVLSSKLKIHSYDLDEIYWLPEWKINPSNIFNEKINHITKNKEWIVSGNYFSRQNTIIQNCDTVIFLKIGFVTRFYRALIRGIFRSINNTPICNGNYETLKQNFLSKDSLLLYIIKTNKRLDKEIENLKLKYKDKNWIVLSSTKEINKFLTLSL